MGRIFAWFAPERYNKTMSIVRRAAVGFTIVELLIVVVIIAILAAITITTYSGIQQRANNAAIIDAASKTYRILEAYIGANDAYPSKVDWGCITVDTGCRLSGPAVPTSTYLLSNLATIGTTPKSIPGPSTYRYGISYSYDASRTVDGVARPLTLHYFLYGTSQQCQLSGVINSAYPGAASSATGYTQANDGGSGMTYCMISPPGPLS